MAGRKRRSARRNDGLRQQEFTFSGAAGGARAPRGTGPLEIWIVIDGFTLPVPVKDGRTAAGVVAAVNEQRQAHAQAADRQTVNDAARRKAGADARLLGKWLKREKAAMAAD